MHDLDYGRQLQGACPESAFKEPRTLIGRAAWPPVTGALALLPTPRWGFRPL